MAVFVRTGDEAWEEEYSKFLFNHRFREIPENSLIFGSMLKFLWFFEFVLEIREEFSEDIGKVVYLGTLKYLFQLISEKFLWKFLIENVLLPHHINTYIFEGVFLRVVRYDMGDT